MATRTASPTPADAAKPEGRTGAGRRTRPADRASMPADRPRTKRASSRTAPDARRQQAPPARSREATAKPDRKAERPGRMKRARKGLLGAPALVGGAIAANPVPASLVGAALGWLLLEGRVRRATTRAVDVLGDAALLDRAGQAVGQVSEGLTGAARSVKETVVEGAEAVGTAIAGLGETLQGGASSVRDATRTAYGKGRAASARAWDQHPLAVSAALLATGLAAGLLLPGTLGENGVVGRQSDALKRRAKVVGATLATRGKKVVATIGKAIKSEAAGEGLGAAEVARKVRRIAEHVQDTALKSATVEGLAPGSLLKGAAANGARNGRPRKSSIA